MGRISFHEEEDVGSSESSLWLSDLLHVQDPERDCSLVSGERLVCSRNRNWRGTSCLTIASRGEAGEENQRLSWRRALLQRKQLPRPSELQRRQDTVSCDTCTRRSCPRKGGREASGSSRREKVSVILTKFIKTDIFHKHLHRLKMMSTRGATFTICTLCVGRHDLQSVRCVDYDYFNMGEALHGYVLALFMRMAQCFKLFTFIFNVLVHITHC